MGGVCSFGFKNDDKKLRSTDDDDKSRGLSGKLKSMRRRKTSDSYYSHKYGSSRRKSSKPNEILFNFSGELGPVPSLRTESTKVYCFKRLFRIVSICLIMCNFSRDTYESCLNTVVIRKISSCIDENLVSGFFYRLGRGTRFWDGLGLWG